MEQGATHLANLDILTQVAPDAPLDDHIHQQIEKRPEGGDAAEIEKDSQHSRNHHRSED